MSKVFNGIRFDSSTELSFYKKLLEHFPPNEIDVHHQLWWLTRTTPRKAASWKVDFKVQLVSYIPHAFVLVEVKCVLTPNFLGKLFSLRESEPATAAQLVIASPNITDIPFWGKVYDFESAIDIVRDAYMAYR